MSSLCPRPSTSALAASGVINTVQDVGRDRHAAAAAPLPNRRATPCTNRPRGVRLPCQARSGPASCRRQKRGQRRPGADRVRRPRCRRQAPQVAHQILQLANAVLTNVCVGAMRPTLVLPTVIVALAALDCAGADNLPRWSGARRTADRFPWRAQRTSRRRRDISGVLRPDRGLRSAGVAST